MLLFIAVLLAAAALAAQLANRGWPFELFANARPQIAAAGALLAGLALLNGDLLALLVAAGAGAAAGLGLPPVRISPEITPARSDAHPRFTIVFCNVQGRPSAAEAVARLGRAERADLVCLAGAPEAVVAEAATVFAEFPHRSDTGFSRAPSGARLLAASRRTLPATIAAPIAPHGAPVLRLTPTFRDGRAFATLVLHAPAARDAKSLADRDSYLRQALDALPDHGRWLAVGDFSATPWSPVFSTLPGRRAGEPLRESTWFSALPLAGLALDHALLGPGVRLVSYRVGPDMGARHRPLILTIAPA